MRNIKAKIWLIGQGITQREICKAIPGLSEPFLSMLLAGDKKSHARLDQIATYLGISRQRLDSLIGGKKKGVSYAKLRSRRQPQAVPVDRSAAPSSGASHEVIALVAAPQG